MGAGVERSGVPVADAWGAAALCPSRTATKIDGKQSPNPFVVPRFIGAVQRNPVKDRMNAVTTNGS